MSKIAMPERPPLRFGASSSSSSAGRRTLPVWNDASSDGIARTRPANAGSSGIAEILPPNVGPLLPLLGSDFALPRPCAHAAVLRPSGGGPFSDGAPPELVVGPDAPVLAT